ncbi:MAG TPA: MXAN_2562 family outer membrane beta-barrel protein [Polyangia bacterium]|nr:MXAN_2562 family outer membrane beta-barrel protein [Polyangia bacterium]
MKAAVRSLRVVAFASLAVLAWPAAARAQTNILEEAPAETPYGNRYHSPQHFAFELKFGPFRPDVDSEFANNAIVRTPYASYFGTSDHLLSQIEFDWQILHPFGSIALGVGIGYFSVTGTAPLANGTGMLSGDTSSFRVIPTSLSAVYRFDRLLEDRNIPIVPYGKLGLDYSFWRITNGNGDVAHDAAGKVGEGGTLGWHGTLGVALVLDFLDPEAAREFDSDLGVNHTAIAFEFTHADVSGLGQSGRLHVGDTTWALGVLLEF